MKSITQTQITYNKLSYSKHSRYPYSVSIGNGQSKNFLNLVKAQTFRAETNKHYNKCMEDLVLISANVYSLYRKYWLYNDINAKDLLHSFETSMDNAIKQQNYGNGPYYVCRSFIYACETLMEICEKMMTKKQNRVMMNREASNYKEKIQIVLTRLKDFGKPKSHSKP